MNKNIIQIVSPIRDQPLQKPTQVPQNKSLAQTKSITWDQFRGICQKFLQNLQLEIKNFVALRYFYERPNVYQVKFHLVREALEKMVVSQISHRIAFFDLEVRFHYTADWLTVKIVIMVQQKPDQMVEQVYTLTNSAA